MDKIKKNKLKGSVTVEAAFIMPIVLLTIFAIIYLAFYLHDMCRIQGVVDKTLHKAGVTVKHEANFETGEVLYENINDRGVFYLLFGSTKEEEIGITNYLQQELKYGLFISNISGIQVEVGNFNISLSVEVETKMFLKGIMKFFDPHSKKVIKGKGSIHNPAETIRLSEVILDTGSKIKGVKVLKEKLDNFIK